MSRKLRLLEERLQTALITRTTCQWSLTEAGREYYERGLGVISTFDEFETRMRRENVDLSGEIKISVPLYFGRTNLSDPLIAFCKLHPSVHLNLEFSDRIVDVINEQFDLVVRIAEMPDSTLVTRTLCQTRHLCCASPDYIANNTPILQPEDLRLHKIIQRGSSKRTKWFFKAPGKKQIGVALNTSLNSHDGEFLITAATQSLGVIRVPDFLAQPGLDSGQLVPVLPDYELPTRDIYIVYPTSRYLPLRTRELMNFLLDNFNNSDSRTLTISGRC